MINRGLAAVFFLLMLCSNALAFNFVAAGDVLLDRGIRQEIELNGSGWPLRHIGGLIPKNSLAIFNLESSLASKWRPGPGKYRFMGNPEFLNILSNAGFDAATVANNHTCDFGPKGFDETLSALGGHSIKYAGVSGQPLFMEKDGVRIAILAYTDVLNVRPTPCAKLAVAHLSSIKKDIESVRNIVDVVIVYFHWGKELETSPDNRQRALAHAAIDDGATLVIGSHPHVLQGIERYKNGLIVYSLGDFLFDNYSGEEAKSALFECGIEKGRIISPHFIPIENNGDGPAPAGKKDAAWIMARLRGDDLELFRFPIKQYIAGGFKVLAYRHEIQTEDIQGRKINSIAIPFKGQSIMDAAFTSDRVGSAIYFIFGNAKARRLGFADFDGSSGKLGVPHMDSHDEHYPWRIYPCDLDGNGVHELCVGVRKTTRYDKTVADRLYVYGRTKRGIYPVWFGSWLGLPFSDFAVCGVRGGVDEIVTLGENPDGAKEIVAYKHAEFGFNMAGIIEPKTKRTGLTGYCYQPADIQRQTQALEKTK